MAAMLLRERLVAGPRGAAEVGNGNRFALQKRGRASSRKFRYAARGGATGSSTSNSVLLAVGLVPSIDSSRRLEMAPPFGEILSA